MAAVRAATIWRLPPGMRLRGMTTSRVRHYTTTSRITGQASPEGTARFCSRHSVAESTTLPRTGWEVCAVGFGGYRISDTNSTNMEALRVALSSGINVFDTACNFNDGHSEIAVGKALTEAINRGHVKREEIVLMSKGGYVQGSALADMQAAKWKPSQLTVVSDKVWHSLSPDLLCRSLGSSLDRMNVDSLDVYWLNNPETALRDQQVSVDGWYGHVRDAFAYLEEEVKKGRISCYGVASNVFSASLHRTRSSLSVPALLQIAKNVAGEEHHFMGVQYPFNLYQQEAARGPSHAPSIMSYAKESGLWQFTNRTFNAITPDKRIRRLANYPDAPEDLADKTATAFQTAITLEEQLQNDADSELLEAVDRNHRQARSMAQELLSHTDLLADYFVLQHFLNNTVVPGTQSLCDVMEATDGEWEEWAENYRQAIDDLRGLLLSTAQQHANEENNETSDLLTSLAPALKSSHNLAQKVTRVSLATGVDCVLLGLTRKAYVADAVASIKAEPPLDEADLGNILTCPTFSEE